MGVLADWGKYKELREEDLRKEKMSKKYQKKTILEISSYVLKQNPQKIARRRKPPTTPQ